MDFGYGIIARSVARDPTLSAEAKAIYLYLCSFAGSGSECFPSLELMCDELNMGRNRFEKHMKTLIDKGYVSKKRERNGNRLGKNIYSITDGLKRDSLPLHFEALQNEDIQNEALQNRAHNNNSSNNNSSNNNSSKGKKASIPWKPPSLEEVKEYCQNNNIATTIPDQWYDYYSANGWKVGSNYMRDWQASLRTWDRRNKQNGTNAANTGKKKNSFNNFHQRDYGDDDELERFLLNTSPQASDN